MLAMGTIALFGYVTSMVVRYFGDSLGVPTALALTGALILVLTAVGSRLLKVMKNPQPENPQPERVDPEKPAAEESIGQKPSTRQVTKAD
jgi:hypothetical protein